MRAKAVADGQQVEIPVLLINRTVGTQEDRQTGEWKDPVKHKAETGRQIRRLLVKCDKDRNKVGKLSNPHCREKPLWFY